jgi:hypothetical protein
MGSTVSTRTCWRCARAVPDDASMCRYCNTAMPMHTLRAPSSSTDDTQWVSAGRATSATSSPRAATAAPARLGKAGAHEPGPFADNPSFDVWPESEPEHPVGFSGGPAPSAPAPPAHARPPRSLRGVASAVAVLFGVEVVALLVNAFARFQEAGLVADVTRDPRSVSPERITANSDLVEASGWASVGLAVLAVVALMALLYRATVNARTWDPSAAHAPHMAITGYFIPFANLVLPWLVLRQALVVGARRARRAPCSWLVLVWALCQAGGYVGRAVFGARYEQLVTAGSVGAVDLDAAPATIQALAGSSALLAVAFAVGIVTVLRLAAIHDRPVAA